MFVVQVVVRQHMFSAAPNFHHQIVILITVLFLRMSQLTFSIQLPADTAFMLNIRVLTTRYFVTCCLLFMFVRIADMLQCYDRLSPEQLGIDSHYDPCK